MIDRDATRDETSDGPLEPTDDAIASTESYETEDGVVLFDAQNLLAWIQATTSVRLDDAA
jgi:hypothetical protein